MSLEKTIGEQEIKQPFSNKTWLGQYSNFAWKYGRKSVENGLILRALSTPIELATLEDISPAGHFALNAGTYLGYLITMPIVMKYFSKEVRKSIVKIKDITIPYWMRYTGRQVGVAIAGFAIKTGLYMAAFSSTFEDASETAFAVGIATAVNSMLTENFEKKKQLRRYLVAASLSILASSYAFIPNYSKKETQENKQEQPEIQRDSVPLTIYYA